MTCREIFDDNLTTDACPSSPTKEKVDIEEILNDTQGISESIAREIPSTYKLNSKKSKSKTKKVQSNPIANVIHIENCNDVQIGQKYTVHVHKNEKSEKNKRKHKQDTKTDAVNKLFVCQEPVTREHIMLASTHVGEGWRDIGRMLNYSEGQIHQFEETHISKGIKEVIYQLLLDWIQNEPDKATVGKLTETLWNTCQESVVHMLSEKLQLNNKTV